MKSRIIRVQNQGDRNVRQSWCKYQSWSAHSKFWPEDL